MNDNCDAIFKAVKTVLVSLEKPGSCYVHMLRNVDKSTR